MRGQVGVQFQQSDSLSRISGLRLIKTDHGVEIECSNGSGVTLRLVIETARIGLWSIDDHKFLWLVQFT